MKKILLLITVLVFTCSSSAREFVSSQFNMTRTASNISQKLAKNNHVFFYSIPNCGKCTRLTKELNMNGIPYKKITVDRKKADEVALKMHTQGITEIGFPSFKVNGTYISSRDLSIDDVIKKLRFKD